MSESGVFGVVLDFGPGTGVEEAINLARSNPDAKVVALEQPGEIGDLGRGDLPENLTVNERWGDITDGDPLPFVENRWIRCTPVLFWEN